MLPRPRSVVSCGRRRGSAPPRGPGPAPAPRKAGLHLYMIASRVRCSPSATDSAFDLSARQASSFRAGRIARTAVPSLSSGISVAFVAARCIGARSKPGRRHRMPRSRMATRACCSDSVPGYPAGRGAAGGWTPRCSPAGQPPPWVDRPRAGARGRLPCVHFDQFRLEVGADLGEHGVKPPQGIAVEHIAPVLRYEYQMDVHGKDTMSSVSQVLDVGHRPTYGSAMKLRQAFKYSDPKPSRSGRSRPSPGHAGSTKLWHCRWRAMREARLGYARCAGRLTEWRHCPEMAGRRR